MHRFRSNKWLLITVFSLVAMLLVAASAQTVTLRFNYWRMGTDPQASIMNDIIADFEAKHPNIRIEVEPTPQASVINVLTTQILAGSPPDVFVINHTDLPRFVVMEGVLPLDPYLEQDPEFTNALVPQGIEMNTINGHVYGLPHAFGSNALFYNRELFARAGLPDRVPADEEEFIEFGKQISALGDDIYGFALFGGKDVGTDVRFFELFWAWDVDAVQPEEGIVNIDSPEGIEAFQYIVDLHRVHDITTASPTEIDYPSALRLFMNGNLGMFQANVGSIAPIEEGAPDLDFNVGPLRWKAVGSKIDGSGFSIASATQHPDEAWEFVRHLMSYESIRDWAVPLSYLPTRTDVAELPEIQQNEYLRIYFDEVIPYGKPVPSSIYFNELMEVARRELSLALLGQKTAEQAARDAGQAMRQILARN